MTSDVGQRSLFNAAARSVDLQLDNVFAAGDNCASRQRRYNAVENAEQTSHVTNTNKTLETSDTDAATSTSAANDRSPRAGCTGSQHDDNRTPTTSPAATTTTTTSSSSTSSSAGGDLDVFNVESTLPPDMNWDRLEEQLRNALRIERRAEVSVHSDHLQSPSTISPCNCLKPDIFQHFQYIR